MWTILDSTVEDGQVPAETVSAALFELVLGPDLEAVGAVLHQSRLALCAEAGAGWWPTGIADRVGPSRRAYR